MIHCPTCGAPTAVVDTRDEKRRRQCKAGHRFSTREILADELKAHQRLQRKLATHEKLRQRLASIVRLIEWADR